MNTDSQWSKHEACFARATQVWLAVSHNTSVTSGEWIWCSKCIGWASELGSYQSNLCHAWGYEDSLKSCFENVNILRKKNSMDQLIRINTVFKRGYRILKKLCAQSFLVEYGNSDVSCNSDEYWYWLAVLRYLKEAKPMDMIFVSVNFKKCFLIWALSWQNLSSGCLT